MSQTRFLIDESVGGGVLREALLHEAALHTESRGLKAISLRTIPNAIKVDQTTVIALVTWSSRSMTRFGDGGPARKGFAPTT